MFQPDWDLGIPPTEDPLEEFTWNDFIDFDYEDPTPLPPLQTTFTDTNTHRINVHDWIDGASAPSTPCAHCTQARLQCLVLRTAANANPNPIRACSSCVALFRECSLAAGEKRQPSEFETLAPVYGHMHGLAEEDSHSHSHSHSHGQPDQKPERERGGEHTHVSSLRRGGRVLRNWFHRHHEYPYPTDEEKDALAHESGLSKRQVSNWFSNARRRHKQQYHARRDSSSNTNTRSGSPAPTNPGGFAMMTPMERWQSSPPDSEPVSESAIQNAIVASQLDLPTAAATATATTTARRHEFAADDASSRTGTSRLSSSRSSLAGYSESSGSMTSAWSNHSGIPCDIIQTRRRRRRRETHPAQDHLYQCTFCRYSSKKRHDWARHERSVHLSLESWLCTPDLEAVREAITSTSATCALCDETETSPTHFDDVHDFAICADRPIGERTFGRKDHFWQHLQKFHRCSTFSEDVLQRLDQLCRSQQRTQVRSRCGFCERALQTWEQRAQHLAEHFKQGFRMSQWRGGWGVDENEVELRGVVRP